MNRAGFTQWVVLWTVGGILVLLVELWLAVGREYLILERDKLVHGRALLGIRMQRLYEVEAVGNLRVLRKSDLQIERYSEGLQVWGAGALAFDFRGRRVRVGDGLSEAGGGFVAGHVAQFYGWPRDAG